MRLATLKSLKEASQQPLAGAFLACALAASAQAQWQPTKSVEIVVPAGAGGASDQMARTIQGIVLKHQLMKQPMHRHEQVRRERCRGQHGRARSPRATRTS